MATKDSQLLIREGDRRLLQRSIGPGRYVIGRDKSCDIHIDLLGVSHLHARLVVQDGNCFIEDLGSTNGTFVDGMLIRNRVPLQTGQLVEVATAILEIRPPDVARGDSTAHTLVMAEDYLSELPKVPVPAADALRPLNYVVGGELGRGGMGSVLYAKDLNIRRSVAMKVIPPEKRRAPRDMLRFIEEAQVTGQLEHPNIMPIHELGQDDQGRVFYTMKHVKGVTLKNVLDAIGEGKKDVIAKNSLPHLLTIFDKVCDAVAFAHSKGVVHRDLKPDNVMLGDYGEVLVMDWGLAKILSPTGQNPAEAAWVVQSARALEGEPHQTLDGTVMGTPHFMSPEQVAGDIDQIDLRTDIFTLGGILYNILTLHPPHPGDTIEEAMRQARQHHTPDPAEYTVENQRRRRQAERAGAQPAELLHYSYQPVPDSLAAVALKALASSKFDRYQSVKELQRDLEAYRTGFATAAEKAGPLKNFWLMVKRHKAVVAVLTVSLAVIVTFGVGAVRRIIESEHRAVETLDRLHASAPAYLDMAMTALSEGKFSEALQKLSSAVLLEPGDPEYHYLRGNLLESLFRFNEARDEYARTLQLNKFHERAAGNLEACERILRDTQRWGEPLPSSLHGLLATMRKQDRAVEAAALAKLLQADQQMFFNVWRDILAKLDVPERISTLKVDDAGLFSIDLSATGMTDISALKGVPIVWLDLSRTKVLDLSPLEGMPLTYLNLDETPVTDLGPLRGMPLTQLSLWRVKVGNLTPLKGMPLKRLMLADSSVADLSPLQKMPLNHLALDGTFVSDLTPLNGLPLVELHLDDTLVADLAPLRGMGLTLLSLSRTPITNLDALREMPLTILTLRYTKICDLHPLREMPLKYLNLKGCAEIDDLTPLAQCRQLERLIIPDQCKDLEFLRMMDGLQYLAYGFNAVDDWAENYTVETFWKNYDVQRRAFGGASNVSGASPAP